MTAVTRLGWRGRRPSRDTVASSLGAVVFSLSLGAVSLALPLLALASGYTAVQVGLLTAVSAVSQTVVRSVLGVAMRHWPDRYLVTAASLLLAGSNALLVVSAAAVPFVIAELVQGLARACFWTGSQTHVVRGSGSAVGAMAVINFFSSVGLLGGPVLAGALSESSPVLALEFATVTGVLGAVPGLFLDKLPPFRPPERRQGGLLWRQPGVSSGCWAGVTAGAWRGLVGSYIPVALSAARQSTSTIGALVSVANGASVLGALLVGRVRPTATPRAFAFSTVAAGIGTGVTAAVAGHPVLSALSLAVSGLGAGALQTLGPAIASDSVHPEERGNAIAAAGTFRAAALFASPMAVAGLLGVLPLAAAMGIAAVGIALPVVTVRSLVRHAGAQPVTAPAAGRAATQT